MTSISITSTTRPTTTPAADEPVRQTAEPSTPPVRPRRATPMLAELDREWERLRRRPTALRAVRAWTGDETFERLVAGVRSLDGLLAATQPHFGAVGDGDAVLRRLVELAATDELAGRIVLQRLLPGLISQSRRWMGRAAVCEPSDIAIGAAWIAIRGFDVRSRSRHVAPALITDSLWIGFRREARKRVETEVPISGDILAARPSPARSLDPICALAGTIRAAARAGVRSTDLDLIRVLLVEGGPARAARSCEVTVRTIRNRRTAAARRIRRALGPDWADWSDPLVAA